MPAAGAPGISVEQQQEHLLHLLATINPNLTAAVKHALAVGQSNPHALQAQQPQQQQTGAPDLHHLRNLQPQQQQIRALDLNHFRNLPAQAQGPHSLTAHSSVAPVSSIGSSNNSGSNPKMAGVTQGFNGMQGSKINSNQSQLTASTSTLLGTRSKTENASASTLSSVKTNEANLKSAPALLSDGSSPESLSLLTLQSWSIEKLESYANEIKAKNPTDPLPNTLRIVLENARNKEEKKLAKRIANRKSASVSRARKNQLIDELTACHAKLRRQVLILSYLPDPVVAIDTRGVIKFCSVQMERVLKYKMDSMIGSSIENIIMPESRYAMQGLIRDLLVTEGRVTAGKNEEESQHEVSNGTTSDENEDTNPNGSGSSSSSNANAATEHSGQTFPMLEVNFNGEGKPITGKKHKILPTKSPKGLSSLTQKSSSLTTDTDNDEPQLKKVKIDTKKSSGSETSFSHKVTKHDEAIGISTNDNKLSSLVHHPNKNEKEDDQPHIHRKCAVAARSAAKKVPTQDDSGSSSSNDSEQREGAINSSESSGYRDSNESSDPDSSSISGTSITSKKKKVKLQRPLVPSCQVWIISGETKIYCELTASIRTSLGSDDRDSQLNTAGQDPDSASDNPEEKEILLCFRPLRQVASVNGELHFSRQKSVTDADTDTPPLNGSDLRQR
jgi:PAS domain-containing protein